MASTKLTVSFDKDELVAACIKKIVEDGTLVEVVRCKNCRYYETDDDTWCVFHDAHWVKHENDFCSYGEWRDDVRKSD